MIEEQIKETQKLPLILRIIYSLLIGLPIILLLMIIAVCAAIVSVFYPFKRKLIIAELKEFFEKIKADGGIKKWKS